MKSSKKSEKIIIGWREFVDLPDWGIKGMRAKMDTGALTSSLDVDDIKELPGGYVEFHVVLNTQRARKKVKAKIIKSGRVKSSVGNHTHRIFVETEIKLANKLKKVPLNLIAREGMTFRMLIGRNALRREYIVDSGRSFLGLPAKKRRKKRLKK